MFVKSGEIALYKKKLCGRMSVDRTTERIKNRQEGITIMKEKYVAYVGTYTHGSSIGIHLYDVNVEEGTMTERKVVPVNNSSHLAISVNGKYLYSIADEGVAVFSIEPDGDLTFINKVGIDGMRGCHLSTDTKGKYLYVAGYHDGNRAARTRSGRLCALRGRKLRETRIRMPPQHRLLDGEALSRLRHVGRHHDPERRAAHAGAGRTGGGRSGRAADGRRGPHACYAHERRSSVRFARTGSG